MLEDRDRLAVVDLRVQGIAGAQGAPSAHVSTDPKSEPDSEQRVPMLQWVPRVPHARPGHRWRAAANPGGVTAVLQRTPSRGVGEGYGKTLSEVYRGGAAGTCSRVASASSVSSARWVSASPVSSSTCDAGG